MKRLHRFNTDINKVERPKRFTYPFCYTPHPLCIEAANEVQKYLLNQTSWQKELAQGKMFGVLVVEDKQGEIGFLAAFSGILLGSNNLPYFVPAVYDLLEPDGFFKQEEDIISNINRLIKQIENTEQRKNAWKNIEKTESLKKEAILLIKNQINEAKTRRDERRKLGNISAKEEAEMIRESQFMKAELKRAERMWKEKLDKAHLAFNCYEEAILTLKHERKERSAALQQKLFSKFEMLNYLGEKKDLCEIFTETIQKTPPAGAGECAAPKLLQYAYRNGLKPLAMAEFWWGNSPKNEVRHHGYYYPSCKGKCEPILKHMLQGLEVDENPMLQQQMEAPTELPVLYEDDWIVVVNKPNGLLSVPSKDNSPSVYSIIKQRYPEADGPMMVHRLDFGTSGVLIITKCKEAHQRLQGQFTKQEVEKRYIALLQGISTPDTGCINLPLRLNQFERPHQMVDQKLGKPAITHYQVLERKKDITRMAFYPQTGRTHQLRVHASHPDGLNCPIVGDELYGTTAERLYLHAERIRFTHPISGEWMEIVAPVPF